MIYLGSFIINIHACIAILATAIMSATYFPPVISQDSITVTQIVPTKNKKYGYIAEVHIL